MAVTGLATEQKDWSRKPVEADQWRGTANLVVLGANPIGRIAAGGGSETGSHPESRAELFGSGRVNLRQSAGFFGVFWKIWKSVSVKDDKRHRKQRRQLRAARTRNSTK